MIELGNKTDKLAAVKIATERQSRTPWFLKLFTHVDPRWSDMYAVACQADKWSMGKW